MIERNPKTQSGTRIEKTQRYLCKDCKRYFNLRRYKRSRYAPSFVKEAVRRYVEDNTSLRAIAKRMGASPRAILDWINQAGDGCKDAIETDLALSPSWSGILGVDGKPVSVSAKKDVALVAVDGPTRDLVHLSLAGAESEEDFGRFLLEIRDVIKYPLVGLVSDFGKGRVLVKLVSDIFPNTPHQICVVHFLRYMNTVIPRSKKSKHYLKNASLRRMINDILLSRSPEEADRLYDHLMAVKDSFTVYYQKSVIRSLFRNYNLLTNHFRYDFLPRDNNVTENVVRQLTRKLKVSDGYGNRESAYNHLKLWGICYRFKPFTDSRVEGNNGKSPLQLAKIDTSKMDWLEFSRT